MANYGIPYMGSKQKIAKDIVRYIRMQHPEARVFYDIFGGGGAISFEALQQGFDKVVYVDLDKGMCNLMEQIKKGIPKNRNRWISREEFEDIKEKEDAESVAMSIMWSFGNNRRQYLYGMELEQWKKAMHIAVVDQDYSLLEKKGFNFRLNGENWRERRLDLRNHLRGG